jgi:hypothetical protein
MTCQAQDTEALSAVELIAERGMEGLPDALAALINEAMRLERERHLGAGSYERNEARRGYANGYKPKTMKTRMGALSLRVPQVREGGFYPQSLDKGMRSERALKLALAQMYVEGWPRARWRASRRSCAASRSAPPRCPVARRCWIPSSRHGVSVRWAPTRTCCLTRATRKSVTAARSSTPLCWWRWASARRASARCWVCRWSCPKRRCIGATS